MSLAATQVAGQESLDFDRLSLEHGLSQSIIEQIVQDQKGFMWFVTEDGLNRFDGYDFVVYKNVAGDANSLSHNELKAVFEDRSGVLWVGTFGGGLNRFDPATERVTRFRHDPDDPSTLSCDTVRYIYEDRQGALWIGTQGGGLDRLDRSSGQFSVFRHDGEVANSLSHDDVRVILEDNQGVLWVGTYGGGLNRLNPAGGFTHFRHQPDDATSLSDDRVTALLEDSHGELWVGTYGGGLNLFDRDSGRFSRHEADADDATELQSNLIKALCEDHTGALWIGTDGGGLSRFDREQQRFTSFRHDPIDRRSLATDRVWALFQDRSRVLWVGTYGGGLNTFDVGHKKFRHLRNDPDDANSLSHNIVWSFAEDEAGVLWIGTDSGGLNRWDRSTDRWHHYRHQSEDPTSLSHDTVRCVFIDRDGVLWAATNGGGLNRHDPATGGFTHFRHDSDDPGSLSHDELRSVSQDHTGALWIGTFGGGVDRLDPDSGRFTHFPADPEDPKGLSNGFIRLVVEDTQRRLWIGTQGGGLNCLDPATGEVTRYRYDPNDPTSLSNDHVFAVHEAASGSLWIGTFGGGLNRLDPESGRSMRYTTEDGLVSDSIYAMLEDDQGRLWISTTNGLSRFDPDTESFRNYDVRDGLQSNEFNGGSAFSSRRGEMFFGGINGFNVFKPDEIGVNTRVPNVVITELRLFNRTVHPGETVNGRMILPRPITHTEAVRLSYRENVFSLGFAALHYAAPEKNRYQYTLQGFSDTWIRVDADRRFATFTGLAPGDYRFVVRGANSDGFWSDEPASIRVTITPPFWATWWFRLVTAVVLVLLAAVVLSSRVNSVRMKTELRAAHDAQMGIMPQTDPEVEGFDISAECLPAHEVGGDFFDYIWLEETRERLCLVVGDVAGKAMRAAMTAVMSDGMIFSRFRQTGSIEEIMTSLNLSVCHKVSERMFTALCAMVLDPANRELTFANAGLCEPLHRTASEAVYLSSPGPRFPLGVVRSTRYQSRTIRLAEGDVVVVFSDGVPEARNPAGDLYGYDAPRSLLASLNTSAMTAHEIKDALLADVRRFSRGSRQSDDMAVMVVKVAARRD